MGSVIIMNGPPNSGKDAAMEHLVSPPRGEYNFLRRMFKEKLYSLTAAIYGIPLGLLIEVCTDREHKDVPADLLGGLSPRQALIKVSEEVIKPNYGNQYFGEYAASRIAGGGNYVFSDGGFIEELAPVVRCFGGNNVLVVRVHRPDCTFEGDSRDYLPDGLAGHTEDIYNNDTLEAFYEELDGVVNKFMEG